MLRRYDHGVKIFISAALCAAFFVANAWLQPSIAQSISKRMQACTTCHGAGATATVGRTSNEVYFPRIAGKPEAYLFNQLQNFRDGRRHYGLMVGLVEHQNDAALREMAHYFSRLQLPYPEPQAPPAGTPASLMQRGQQLAWYGDRARGIAACASCHGASLQGAGPSLSHPDPYIPGLLGLPRDYLAGQIGAWQTGMRKAQAPDCMAKIALTLSAQDVSAVVTWLAAQPVPALSQRFVAGAAQRNAAASMPYVAAMPADVACGGSK
jgi:cytochrome c553